MANNNEVLADYWRTSGREASWQETKIRSCQDVEGMGGFLTGIKLRRGGGGGDVKENFKDARGISLTQMYVQLWALALPVLEISSCISRYLQFKVKSKMLKFNV